MATENPYVRKKFFFVQHYRKKIHIVMLDGVGFEDVSDDLNGWFFDIEALHGVYPPENAAPAQVVDAIEGLIVFIRKSEETSPSSKNDTTHIGKNRAVRPAFYLYLSY